MKIVSELTNRKEFEDMKDIMEIFIVNTKIKQLAQNS